MGTSKNKYLQWTKFLEVFKISVNRTKFNPLYSMHESFHHFEHDLNEILTRWDESKEMTNPEFIFTAIAFMNAIEKIEDFSADIKKQLIEIIENQFIPKNFEEIVKSNIFIHSFNNLEGRGCINWNQDAKEVLKKHGILDERKYNKFHEESNKWLWVLKEIRNKLVHPNSDKLQVINLLGNFNFDTFYKDEFHFKPSFSNDESFIVSKGIFLEALLKIQQECKMMIPIWNRGIDQISKNKIKIRDYDISIIKDKLDRHVYGSNKLDSLLSDQWEMVDLYLAAKALKNENMEKFVITQIKMHNIFSSVYNYSFFGNVFASFSILHLRNKYIRDWFTKQNSQQGGYASEKIGYWNDEESRIYFKDFFKQVDKDQPGIEPYNIRIIAYVSKQINWKKLAEDAHKQYLKWKNKSIEEISNMAFKSMHSNEEFVNKYLI